MEHRDGDDDGDHDDHELRQLKVSCFNHSVKSFLTCYMGATFILMLFL